MAVTWEPWGVTSKVLDGRWNSPGDKRRYFRSEGKDDSLQGDPFIHQPCHPQFLLSDNKGNGQSWVSEVENDISKMSDYKFISRREAFLVRRELVEWKIIDVMIMIKWCYI